MLIINSFERGSFIIRLFFIVLGMCVQQKFVEAGDLGVGITGIWYQPPLKDAKNENVVWPFLYYEGERFSVDFQRISYRLISDNNFDITALGQLRLQGYQPDDSGALAGMEAREPTIEAGVSASYLDKSGALSVVAVTDVGDVYNGQEVDLFYSFFIFSRHWLFEPSFGVRWLSADLVDYYYGVRISEARPGRPAYQGQSTLNMFTNLSLTYSLTPRWYVFGDANYTYLGSNIRQNSIIERNYEVTAILGLIYIF